MKKNKLIRFVQSLVLLPAMTMSFSGGNINTNQIAQNILVQKVNITAYGTLALNQASDSKADEEALAAQDKAQKAKAIDTYFGDRNMPLAGTGAKMVEEAEKNGLDWRLLPAIAVRESTGGKNDCNKVEHNAFGWGSCKIGFKSDNQAIEAVARNLGGNNPNTASHYDNKTTIEILHAYNPPSVVPKYGEQVISIMNAIGPEEFTITPAITT